MHHSSLLFSAAAAAAAALDLMTSAHTKHGANGEKMIQTPAMVSFPLSATSSTKKSTSSAQHTAYAPSTCALTSVGVDAEQP
jgi:hypothetical protein